VRERVPVERREEGGLIRGRDSERKRKIQKSEGEGEGEGKRERDSMQVCSLLHARTPTSKRAHVRATRTWVHTGVCTCAYTHVHMSAYTWSK